mgnify:CR=1 FL=1
MKKLVTSLLAAVTIGTAMLATVGTADAQYRPRWHHHHRGGIDPGAAAALGVLGGLAIGGALAQQDYYYEDEPVVVRRRPVRVYEEDYVVKRRATPRCRTIIKYDMYGKPYEWKDCN